jgi:hypothetical protein
VSTEGQLLVTYDDFTGGHWGPLADQFVPKNKWYGLNVQLYPNGAIGPRNPVRQLIPSGLPTTSAGRPQIMFARDGKVFFLINTAIYYIDSLADTSATAVTGTVAGGTSSSAAQLYTDLRLDRYWINRVGLAFGYVDGGTNTWVAVTTPAAFRMIAVKGGRMVGCAGRVLYYSDNGDFTSWPALNTIDLGEGSDIQAMHASGDTLYVFTEASTYIVQGTLGNTTTVRQVAGTGMGTFRTFTGSYTGSMGEEPWRSARLSDDSIAFVSKENWGGGNFSTPNDNEFNKGTAVVSMLKAGQMVNHTIENYCLAANGNYEVMHAGVGEFLAIASQGRRARVGVSDNLDVLLVRPDGYVEAHELGTTNIQIPLGLTVAPQVANDVSATVGPDVFAWATWDGSNCDFFYWKVSPGINAASSDNGYDSVDGFDDAQVCEVTLAPYFTPDGSYVRPRAITVHGLLYNATGSAAFLDCRAMALAPNDAIGNNVAAYSEDQFYTISFGPGTIGVHDFSHRFLLGAGVDFGTGFKIKLSLTRCAITKVIVHCDTRPNNV